MPRSPLRPFGPGGPILSGGPSFPRPVGHIFPGLPGLPGSPDEPRGPLRLLIF